MQDPPVRKFVLKSASLKASVNIAWRLRRGHCATRTPYIFNEKTLIFLHLTLEDFFEYLILLEYLSGLNSMKVILM